MSRDRTRSRYRFSVVLQEELFDLCAAHSTCLERVQGDLHYTYQLSGLSLKATLGSSLGKETQEEKSIRGKNLLDPLTQLRFLRSVQMEGATLSKAQHVSKQLCLQEHDSRIVSSTFFQFWAAGDKAYAIGHVEAANGYYSRASH